MNIDIDIEIKFSASVKIMDMLDKFVDKILAMTDTHIFIMNQDDENLFSICRIIQLDLLQGMSRFSDDKNKYKYCLILHVSCGYDIFIECDEQLFQKLFDSTKYIYWQKVQLNIPVFDLPVKFKFGEVYTSK